MGRNKDSSEGWLQRLGAKMLQSTAISVSTSGENQIKRESYSPGFYYHEGHFPPGASSLPLVRHVSSGHHLKVGLRPSSLPSTSHDQSIHEKSLLGLYILLQRFSHWPHVEIIGNFKRNTDACIIF